MSDGAECSHYESKQLAIHKHPWGPTLCDKLQDILTVCHRVSSTNNTGLCSNLQKNAHIAGSYASYRVSGQQVSTLECPNVANKR